MQFLKITSIFFWFIFIQNTLLNAQSYDNLIETGKANLDKKEYDKAKNYFENALQIKETAECYHLIGRCFLNKDKIDEAISHFEKAIKSDENYANAYYNLGRCYEIKENYEKALDLFQKFSKLKPKDTDGWLAQATIYTRLKKTFNTRLSLDKAINTDTTNWQTYKTRAEFYYNINQPKSALLDINKALKLNSKNDTLWLYSGQTKADLGDFNTALDDLNKALEINPNYTKARLEIASIYLSNGQPEKTINACQAILKEHKENLSAMILLAYAYQEREEYQRSIDWAKKASDIDPKDAQTLELLGKSYFFNNDYKEAEEIFAKAIALNPKEIAYYSFKVYAKIYKHTNLSVFKTRQGLAFKDINSFQTKSLDKKVSDEKSPYFYPILKDKFENKGSQMGLDEYFMLYYGASSQKNYAPYGDDAKRKKQVSLMVKMLDDKKYKHCARVGEQFLTKYPFALRVYLYTAIAYFEVEDYKKYEDFIGKYRAFLSAILASGNGQSEETAYIVTSIVDEYIVLNSLHLKIKSQSLIHKKGHRFDLMKTGLEGEEEQEVEVYFNIDKPFQSFGR